MITFGINSRFQELFPTWGQITHAFLTLAPLRYCYRRSTCMPNPCRQRSFWARIKLSVQKLFCSRQVCLCFFLLFQKVEFTFDSNFPYQNSTVFASLFEFDSGHSHYSIFQGTPDFAIRCISFTQLHFKAEQRVLNISRLSDFSSGIRKIFHFFFHSEFCVSEFTCFNLELNDHRRFAARGLI